MIAQVKLTQNKIKVFLTPNCIDSQKLILIDQIKNPNAKISFPIYPNEITAVMSQTFKSKDSIDYTNYT